MGEIYDDLYMGLFADDEMDTIPCNVTPPPVPQEQLALCKHRLPSILFDYDRAKSMTTEEVRKAFPRYYGPCLDCKVTCIGYASHNHFVCGDW